MGEAGSLQGRKLVQPVLEAVVHTQQDAAAVEGAGPKLVQPVLEVMGRTQQGVVEVELKLVQPVCVQLCSPVEVLSSSLPRPGERYAWHSPLAPRPLAAPSQPVFPVQRPLAPPSSRHRLPIVPPELSSASSS